MLFDPLAQTIAAYDELSDQYSDRWFKSGVVQHFFEQFASHLNQFSVVLDAGCGSGREIKQLIDRNIDCIGVDLSYETIKHARANVDSGFFRVMDVRNLEFPDNLFDGVLCIAVVHHLFDRDFKKALSELARVTKPDGVIGMTIRLGKGYKIDALGRFMALRNQDDIEAQLLSLGFSIIESKLSAGGQDRDWLQVLLSNKNKKALNPRDLCGFCGGNFFLKENRSAKAPIAASVLWGDDQFYVTLDIAPLVDGHILLCTDDHVLSSLGSEQNLARLSMHKTQIDHVLKRAFNRKAIFLEHGTSTDPAKRDPCIEHAHIHALPLQNEMRNRLDTRIGKLTKFRNLQVADEAARHSEYISYENKRGSIFLKQDGVADLPSQFFRLVVAESQDIEDYHWIPNRDKPETRERFLRTLRTITDVLDVEIANREIVSDIPQDMRSSLEQVDEQSDQGPTLSKIASRIAQKLSGFRPEIPIEQIELSDIGEREIVQSILVPYFDEGYRGLSYIGDDAAVLEWEDSKILATTDHCPKPLFFDLGIESYHAYGWLSVVISISDIAAMGGTPKAILLNTEMPPDMKALDYLSFVDGVSFAAQMYDSRVIGGNIKEAQRFSAATTVLGDTNRGATLHRDGAEPGQALFVAGEMGLFWAGIFERHHNLLLPLENHREIKAGFLYPEAKLSVAQELIATGLVGACMDASDGPTQAIQNLASSSACDFVVDVDMLVPSQSVALVAKYMEMDPLALMFTWGNFELVFTAPEDQLYQSLGTDLHTHKIRKIGYVKTGKGKAILANHAKKSDLPQLSTEQFTTKKFTPLIESYTALLKKTVFQQ